MTEQDDVLLLQDDLVTDLSLNDNSGYDIHQLFDAGLLEMLDLAPFLLLGFLLVIAVPLMILPLLLTDPESGLLTLARVFLLSSFLPLLVQI
jgi:hypothetical protein